MNREESIPCDVVIEILSRLPSKSVARFRLASKLWRSMLHRPYFTELFLTRQRALPRLFFAISRKSELCFYSSPQSPNPSYSRFHIKFPAHGYYQHFVSLTSGLIYFSRTNLSRNENEDDMGDVVCNPNTAQYAILPKLMTRNYYSYGFLGFDPIDKQFKVLMFMAILHGDPNHYILTLETGQLSWRMIHCPFIFSPPFNKGICINGVLYYSAYRADEHSRGIVCFDIRSETFKFVAIECFYDGLINFEGKLGGIRLEKSKAGGIELSLRVLKDAEKEEWLNYIYTLWDEDLVVNFDQRNISVAGMTAIGEIVLSMKYTSKPFYVFYYNPEKNTLQKVEIQGLGEYHHDQSETVSAFVDHVDDLDIMDAKQLKSNKGLEIIKKRPKPQKPPTSAKSSTIKTDKKKYELVDNLE